MDRRIVTVSIYSLNDRGDGQMPIDDFLGSLTAAIEAVPAEYRSTVRLAWETGYEDYIPQYRVEYDRPETDEELAGRRAWEQVYRRDAEEREKREYARLTAKFGKPA